MEYTSTISRRITFSLMFIPSIIHQNLSQNCLYLHDVSNNISFVVSHSPVLLSSSLTCHQIFINGENKVHIDKMMMMAALYKTNTLSWIFIMLAHGNNSLWVVMLFHLYTLS